MQHMDGFIDVFQIMRIELSSDFPAFLKIRILLFKRRRVIQISVFDAGKMAVRRNKALVGDERIGTFIDVCRNHDAVIAFNQILDFVKGIVVA